MLNFVRFSVRLEPTKDSNEEKFERNDNTLLYIIPYLSLQEVKESHDPSIHPSIHNQYMRRQLLLLLFLSVLIIPTWLICA